MISRQLNWAVAAYPPTGEGPRGSRMRRTGRQWLGWLVLGSRVAAVL